MTQCLRRADQCFQWCANRPCPISLPIFVFASVPNSRGACLSTPAAGLLGMVFSTSEFLPCLAQVHIVTAAMYVLELLVNIFADGIQLYAFDNSKRFDLVVVMITAVDGAMRLILRVNDSHQTQAVRVLRSLRVLHMLKFIRCALCQRVSFSLMPKPTA